MPNRLLLESESIAPEALLRVENFHADVVSEVKTAVGAHDVVVVGMGQNPHVGRVREALTVAKIQHHYLGYGSYLSKWKERLAIKLWSGWPTYPQVFVKGVLLGGEDLVKASLADGSLQKRLAQSARTAA